MVVPQNHGFQYYGLWMIWKCRHLGNLRITSPEALSFLSGEEKEVGRARGKGSFCRARLFLSEQLRQRKRRQMSNSNSNPNSKSPSSYGSWFLAPSD